MVIYPGQVDFSTDNFRKYEYSYHIRGANSQISENIKDYFPLDTLDNVDKTKAISLTKEIADELGIVLEESLEIYALDLEHLEADTDYTEEHPKGREWHHWTKEDQVYVIFSRIQQNGLPITEWNYMTSVGAAMGSGMVAVVGTEGLISYSLGGIYDIKQEEDAGQLISFDAALDIVKNKYQDVILTDRITIKEIRLEYVPQIVDAMATEYTLVPTWVFLMEQTTTKEFNGEKFENTSSIPLMIDATTGQEVTLI